MVYCGKPSKGCENCRLKRLRCDQKRPGCGQCSNTRRICLGYRDPADLVFRDESQRITVKFQKKAVPEKANTRQLSPTSDSADQSFCKARKRTKGSATPEQVQVPASIHYPIQEIAVNFLLGDFVRGSHFDYLSSIYYADQTNDILSPIVKAVGLACLSIQTSRPELREDARKLYVDAIANTNLALQREDTARNDNVLASILLLSLYETLGAHTSIGSVAWAAHIQGALTLVVLRGPAQFESKFGLELFNQIAASIRAFCVQHYIRIPRQLRQLTRIAEQHSNPEDISAEFPGVVETMTDFRADIVEGLLIEPAEIILRAKDALRLITELQDKLPPACTCVNALTSHSSPEIYGDYYYTFKNHHVARAWNTSWMGKMRLNTLMYEQMLIMQETTSEQQRRHSLVAEMMDYQQEVMKAAENICASVPQFFPPERGHIPPRNSPTTAMGYFLMWPLFTAGASSLIKPCTREYVIERLRFISRDLKLPQAQKAADMLSQNDYAEDWLHIYHVF